MQAIIKHANATFDELATLAALLRCSNRMSGTVVADAGSHGLLIDRWFNTGNEVSVENAARLPHARPADGTWLHAGGVFSAPRDVGNNFGTRMRGIFTPLESGKSIPHCLFYMAQHLDVKRVLVPVPCVLRLAPKTRLKSRICKQSVSTPIVNKAFQPLL